jgi:hypothetical protein
MSRQFLKGELSPDAFDAYFLSTLEARDKMWSDMQDKKLKEHTTLKDLWEEHHYLKGVDRVGYINVFWDFEKLLEAREAEVKREVIEDVINALPAERKEYQAVQTIRYSDGSIGNITSQTFDDRGYNQYRSEAISALASLTTPSPTETVENQTNKGE